MNSHFECDNILQRSDFTCDLFKSWHKNILEPETSRLCVLMVRSHIHLILKEPQWSH